MSIVPKSIGLSIQRSVKVGEYQYNKIDLEMTVDVKDERPKDIIDKLYAYIDAQVDRLLKAELAKVDRDRQTMADKIPF